jgi:Raf kinase inhibitor-like YbhB/YbcL family protein
VRRAALAGLAVALVGCGGTTQSSSQSSTAAASTATTAAPTATAQRSTPTLAPGLKLSSPAFRDRTQIPGAYTCDGADRPIPLTWSGVPSTARELVLVIRDPNAPTGNFIHWAVAGIPPTATAVPSNGIQGANSFGTLGYRGPCPPHGSRPHHYVITLSALAAPSRLRTGFTPDQLRTAAVGLATLTGTYARR